MNQLSLATPAAARADQRVQDQNQVLALIDLIERGGGFPATPATGTIYSRLADRAHRLDTIDAVCRRGFREDDAEALRAAHRLLAQIYAERLRLPSGDERRPSAEADDIAELIETYLLGFEERAIDHGLVASAPRTGAALASWLRELVEQHPAMLFFLDNQESLGPDSRAGQNRKRGLNENLAREIMELHTLGVGGGYTQEDVTSLARIITGWSFAGRNSRNAAPGSFVFNANAHQPGPQTLLGKVYPDDGVAQGEAALADIARHPSTAKFIATKLARHFVADDPPPALVARLEAVFKTHDGDLRAVTSALIDADEAWSAPLTKIRSPYEFLIAGGRLLSRVPEDPGFYLNALNTLGQPLWAPAGPNGFADTNAMWAAPEGMKLRLDLSAQLASRLGNNLDPRDMLELVAGDAASADTRRTIERAEQRQQALALPLMSPEFQRR
ncbi:MAG: DUF1800 family protein [Bradyrhizobium sp.]|nr:DUF1800 family protein [Bradyrhizobium sp.]